MSFKSKKNAQRLAARKITKRDRGQRKEIGRLTKLLSNEQVQFGDLEQGALQLQFAVNTLAKALDSPSHRALSRLRRMVRIKSEIPANLLESMKVRSSSSVPPK